MHVLRRLVPILALLISLSPPHSLADSFNLMPGNAPVAIKLNTESPLLHWAATAVANDLSTLSRQSFIFESQSPPQTAYQIIVSVDPTLSLFNEAAQSAHSTWEAFAIYTREGNLHITGADTRGAVYGLFTLAEKAGISPWQWWADVPIRSKKTKVTLTNLPIIEYPQVKYRGIFINDEDWGLLPWAANTFEPEAANIGPATYEKVFQLLLRLKANTLWPAMHPGTRAFFAMPGNQAMAEKYQINIGSSHAEPMLRNNVDEWKTDAMGEFNYVANTAKVENYWQTRVQQVSNMPQLTMFTLGMRGVHDSHMQSTKSDEESIEVLENIINRQRQMLTGTFDTPLSTLNQVFTPYKEVLALYDAGMQVPDDVTLVWPDDNYGYIRRLSNAKEQARKGGSGVYYHLSYWGRPHDYLWLSSTHPALIQYEMARAYANGATRLWIANVGDIKPIEYNMEWFLALAWQGPQHQRQQSRDYLIKQIKRDFDESLGAPVADMLLDYYHLAFERRPEFMGWSQTEPTTQTHLTSFTPDQIHSRLAQWRTLMNTLSTYAANINPSQQSAWFQLIEYPLRAAAAMNHKWLYRHLASVTTNPTEQQNYLAQATQAYNDIQQLTERYNQLESAKWQFMMDAKPRRLPVFDKPELIDDTPSVSAPKVAPTVLNPITMTAADNFAWQALPELGYSRNALTILPATQYQFAADTATVEYRFTLDTLTEARLHIATLPTHANYFDHQLTVSLNNQFLKQLNLNTKGRSEAWKQGVLSNRISNDVDLGQLAPGTYVVKLAVNQTGIVIDEVALQSKP